MRGRAAENTFLTRYLANNAGDIRQLTEKTGSRVFAFLGPHVSRRVDVQTAGQHRHIGIGEQIGYVASLASCAGLRTLVVPAEPG